MTAIWLSIALWGLVLAGVLISPLVPLGFFAVFAVGVYLTGQRERTWQRKR